MEAIIGRDIELHRDIGLVIAAAVLIKQRIQPAAGMTPAPADKR